MTFCSNCGKEVPEELKICDKCSMPIMDEEYFKLKAVNNFPDLFSDEKLEKINTNFLTVDAYNMILSNILYLGKLNYLNLLSNIPEEIRENMDAFSKVVCIVEAFCNIHYKPRGSELGSYAFNHINLDDRLDKANQITTLIHELSHHLLAEIFEQVLIYLLEIKKSDASEAFVWFALITNLPNYLMNEYCAHSVEGRFSPYGYQNYGSFNMLLENFDQTKEQDRQIVDFNMAFGNSIANDILDIIEEFIGRDLREEIKLEFKKNSSLPPRFDQIAKETNIIFPPELKVQMINQVLIQAFNNGKDKKYRKTLNDFKKSYKVFNDMYK